MNTLRLIHRRFAVLAAALALSLAVARRLITTIAAGRSPIQAFATPDGNFMYFANRGTEREPDNTVSVIDTRRDRKSTRLNSSHG